MRVPSSRTVKAVRRIPPLSATISVRPSSVSTWPLGDCRSSAAHSHAAVGAHPERLAGPSVGAEVLDPSAHVADVRGAVGAHDHVVERAPRRRRQVGLDRDLAVGLDPEEALGLHGDDQEATVGQPAQTGRLVVLDADDRRRIAIEGGGDHPVVVHVAEPEPTVVPPGSFTEDEVVEDGTDVGRQRHRRTLPAPV